MCFGVVSTDRAELLLSDCRYVRRYSECSSASVSAQDHPDHPYPSRVSTFVSWRTTTTWTITTNAIHRHICFPQRPSSRRGRSLRLFAHSRRCASSPFRRRRDLPLACLPATRRPSPLPSPSWAPHSPASRFVSSSVALPVALPATRN